MQIGVLALQGAFIEHEQMLAKLGVSSFEIRCLDDLKKPFDGLIIPGGESTVIGKLLFELGLFEPIKKVDQWRTADFWHLRRLIAFGRQHRE